MAEIDLEAVKNDATEKYNALIDNLMEENGDDWTYNHLIDAFISPDDFVQTVNDSGLHEVFGAGQSGDVSIYIAETTQLEAGGTEVAVHHPIVIETGTIPPEYENNHEDFADNDGNARITIWDDRLSDIQNNVNNAAAFRAGEDGVDLREMDVAPVKVESITEYNLHNDSHTTERQIDIVRFENSDTVYTIDPNLETMHEEHTTVGNDFSLTRDGSDGESTANVETIKAANPDVITTHDIEYAYDERLNLTVSVDGQEIFTNPGSVDVDDLVAFFEDNSEAISVELNRGDTFESYDNFKESTEARSEWLEYLDDHADAATYIDSHMDEFDKPQEEWTPQDIMQAIDDVENSGILDNVDNEPTGGADQHAFEIADGDSQVTYDEGFRSIDDDSRPPEPPEYVVAEDRTVLADGRVADLTVTEDRGIDGGYDVSAHPVLDDGTVLYGIDMDTIHCDTMGEASDAMNDMKDDWHGSIDHGTDYNNAMENSSYSDREALKDESSADMETSSEDTDNETISETYEQTDNGIESEGKDEPSAGKDFETLLAESFEKEADAETSAVNDEEFEDDEESANDEEDADDDVDTYAEEARYEYEQAVKDGIYDDPRDYPDPSELFTQKELDELDDFWDNFDQELESMMTPEELDEKIDELNDRISSAMDEMKAAFDEDPEGFIDREIVADYDLEGDYQSLDYDARMDGFDADTVSSAVNIDDYLRIDRALGDYEIALGRHDGDNHLQFHFAMDAAKEEALEEIKDAFESYYGSEDNVDNDEDRDDNSFIGRLEDAKDAIMDGISSLLDDIFGDLEKDKADDVDKEADKTADLEKQNENIEAGKTDPADEHIDKDTEDSVDKGNGDIDGDDDWNQDWGNDGVD